MSMFSDKMVHARLAKIEADAVELMKAAAGPRVFVRKGMYEVSRLSSIISDLNSLQKTVAYEALREKDDSGQPATLKAMVEGLIGELKKMVDEESAELIAGSDNIGNDCVPYAY